MKILVCDDDKALLLLLSKYLRATYRAEVKTLSNGKDAPAEVQAFSPDLIILDYMMPGRDGASVLEELRALPAGKRAKVLLYSAFDLSREAVANGADAFLQKPASVDKIKASIDKLVAAA